MYALAHAWGWLLRWQGVLVRSGPHTLTAAVTGLTWLLPSVIAAGIMLVLFLFWWLTLEPARGGRPPWWASLTGDRDRGTDRAALVGLAAILTIGWPWPCSRCPR